MASSVDSYKLFYRTVDELPEPIPAKITGTIPKWIKGTLLRNGPGKFEVEDMAYRHVFDGLALLQQFVIEDGNVSYFNKFLRSQTYRKNIKAGKIVESELGTVGLPDPCKNIFARWFSYFFPKEYTDNASVNFCCIKGKIYAMTEVPIITEIDADSLESLNRVKLSDGFKDLRAIDPMEYKTRTSIIDNGFMRDKAHERLHRVTEPLTLSLQEFLAAFDNTLKDVFNATAHPHEEDGSIYNLNVGYDKNLGLSYLITMIPPATENDNHYEKPLEGAKVVAAIPSRSFHHAYSHSFGMTQKYFVFIQQPLTVNLWKLAASRFAGWSIIETFTWNSVNPECIFNVISRETGDVVSKFRADPFFFFHVANAYDVDGDIVIDICCYPDSKIFHAHYLEEIRNPGSIPQQNNGHYTCQLRRYCLPVKQTEPSSPSPLPKQPSGCDYEILCDTSFDLPRINEKWSRVRHRFVYGSCSRNGIINGLVLAELIKLDIEEKKTMIWSEEGCLVSEAVFIAAPDSQEEDEGVVLSAVYDTRNETSFLLVLDGHSFTEIARAEVPLRFAPTLHGRFLTKTK